MNSTEIKQKTHLLWSKGFNCAECTILLLSEAKEIKPSPELLKMAEIMGSGFKSGCICGALNSSMLFCASSLSQPSEKLTKKLYSDFREKIGSSCCRVLRARDEQEGIPKSEACPKRICFAVENASKELEKFE